MAKKPGYDPFLNIKKNSDAPKGKGLVHVTDAPVDVKISVEAFVKLKIEMKALEGIMEAHSNVLSEYGRMEFAKRAKASPAANFVIDGDEGEVSWMQQEAGSAITAEDHALLETQFGEEAIEALLDKDMGSVRFNAEFLQGANYDKLIAALQPLGADFMQKAFTPASYKVKKGCMKEAPKWVTTVEGLRNLYKALKLKAYPQARIAKDKGGDDE